MEDTEKTRPSIQLCGERLSNGSIAVLKGRVSPSITSVKGKVSWQSEPKEDHKATPQNKPLTRDVLGETQEGVLGREAAGN